MSTAFTPTRLRISVARYQQMVATGVLTRADRVALIDGEILAMAPIGSRHSSVTLCLLKHFIPALGDRAAVGAAHPLDLGGHSEPDPDLLLLRPRPDAYARAHPQAADVLLLVEVADSTLAFDLGTKRGLYARHGVPEYWVVDAHVRRIVVHRQPAHGHYQETFELHLGESASPAVFPEVAIPVAALFP
ncbi:MAG TPA: Uma2 family endonuclease [Steroidobacteraceae bacterium]|nr:Uma2 family endonuclease [Steroidobacteraceae bacterium]